MKRCFLSCPLNNWAYEDPKYEMQITHLFEYRGYDRTLPVFEIKVPGVEVGKVMPFKLIVDGEWYFDPSRPFSSDPLGNINNIITFS